MNVPLETKIADYISETLRRALEVAFSPANETEKETALAVLGAVCKHTATEETFTNVFAALSANIAKDLVVANVLYELDVNHGTCLLRPAALIGLARRAYEEASHVTLASILSILANRPETLVDVDRNWVACALDADRRAGYDDRAATLAEMLSGSFGPLSVVVHGGGL
jgi:hypothetical protein